MTDPHPDDLALLGVDLADLSDDGLSGTFVLGPGLVRHDGALYGGTGLAVSVLAMQAASRRDVLWASTQFVSSPTLGARIDWTAEVLAEGRRSSQVLVRATCDGAVVLTAVGAAGVGKDDGLTGQFREMPQARPPEEGTPWGFSARTPNQPLSPDSWTKLIDLRDTQLVDPAPNQSAMWARRRDGRPFTPVAIAFSADFVPLGVARAAGRLGAGSSLDNSMRFRPGPSSEWVLIEVVGDFASGGYGHGSVRAWSQDGELLGTGSQTAAMRYLWAEGETPQLPIPG